MKQILSLLLMFLTSMILVSCNKYTFDYKPKIVGHDLKDFEEISFDFSELISNLNFNYENKRIVYHNKENTEKKYHNNKVYQQTKIIDKQKFVYQTSEESKFSYSFSGFIYLDYKSSRKGSSYGYEAKVLYDDGNYAFDFKSLKKRDITTIPKGKFQTTNGLNVRLDTQYEYYSIHSIFAQIINHPNVDISRYKLYKDSSNNYLLRKDADEIWSLRFDESYNVISFYNFYESTYESAAPNNEFSKSSIKSEQYIVFNTDLDFSFNYSNYKIIEDGLLL